MSEIAPENSLTVNGKTYTKGVRHYQNDGDLVLLVDDAAFRVSKAMMAKRSMVFQDMMGFTGSSASQMMVDGIPAVVLDDSVQDMVLFLEHILPPASTTTSIEPTPLDTIFRLVRISEKYDARGVTRSARKELNKHLVSDLVPNLRSDLPAYSSTQKLVDLINTLNAHNLPQYLPYAYYKLATWRPTPFDWTPLEHLTHEDRSRIDIGRFALQKSAAKSLGELSNPDSWKCQECDAGRPFSWLEGQFGGKVFKDPFKVIDAYLELINRHDEISGICEGDPCDCWQKVKWALERMRVELFEELVEFCQVKTKQVRTRSTKSGRRDRTFAGYG